MNEGEAFADYSLPSSANEPVDYDVRVEALHAAATLFSGGDMQSAISCVETAKRFEQYLKEGR